MQSVRDFWNTTGIGKDFSDPFYLSNIETVACDSQIVDYGCGYGRVMRILTDAGYLHCTGFDLSEEMVKKGKRRWPDLDLRVLEQSGVCSLGDDSVSLVVISAVLCCNPSRVDQERIVQEAQRILKPGGLIYLIDYLLTDTPQFEEKYRQGGEWGVYRTGEGHLVRHHTSGWITSLLADLELESWSTQWHETMNGNPARMFHCTARKSR